MTPLQIFETITFLSFLVLFHEFGHFLAAKLIGLPVEEFGLGYPPRILGRRFRGTLYSLNLIPFGGFCNFSRGIFSTRLKRFRVLVICAGALANFLLGWLLISLLLVVGKPVLKNPRVEIVGVSPGSPAETAGVTTGDVLVSVAGIKVRTPEEASEEVQNHLGEEVIVVVRPAECPPSRGESCLQQLTVVPRKKPPSGQGPMGIVMSLSGEEGMERVSIWAAPIKGFTESIAILGEIARGVWRMLRKLVLEFRVPRDLAGPVGVYQLTVMASELGLRYLLQFMVFLNLNFFLLNLFPFPALDGGQLLLVAIETVRGKKISPRTEQLVNSIGIALLILLGIALTVQDVGRLIKF